MPWRECYNCKEKIIIVASSLPPRKNNYPCHYEGHLKEGCPFDMDSTLSWQDVQDAGYRKDLGEGLTPPRIPM